MSIITVPHPSLRLTAQPITILDKKNNLLLKELEATLRSQKNPAGVGLAAPQIDVNKRVFATFLSRDKADENAPGIMRLFLNPEVVDHDEELTFGPDPENEILEGCLSIPDLYGPVPRWPRLKLAFQVVENGALVLKEETFVQFHARIIQHEFDHLDGVLFTDYSLKYDLPVYHSPPRSSKLTEVDKRLLESF